MELWRFSKLLYMHLLQFQHSLQHVFPRMMEKSLTYSFKKQYMDWLGKYRSVRWIQDRLWCKKRKEFPLCCDTEKRTQ